MVRQSPSISPNVKVKSDRKQLTDVCPAESVGVPGRKEYRHILTYHRVAPFTPHYPAKNNLFTSSAFCLYEHQSQQVSSFPLKASLNKWQVRKRNSDTAQVQIPLGGSSSLSLELEVQVSHHQIFPPTYPGPLQPPSQEGKQPNCPLEDETVCGFIARSYS